MTNPMHVNDLNSSSDTYYNKKNIDADELDAMNIEYFNQGDEVVGAIIHNFIASLIL